MIKKKSCFVLLKKIVLIRRFEELVAKLFRQGKMQGTTHLSIGQEAVPVGLCYNLNKNDIVTASHRSHHVMIAKGLDTKKLLAELMGKKRGFCGGYAGSMHLFSKKDNFFGSNGIVAANISISTGMALAIKKKREKRIVVTFFGDGATTEGIFHETMNMAALLNLPIVFACENNLYAQSTALKEHSSVIDLAGKIKAAYGVESIKVDGNNLLEVVNASKGAIDFVRKNKKPCFVEFLTYKFCGHSVHDANQVYRKRKEVAKWMKRDPIQGFKEYLLSNKILTKKQLQLVELEVKKELKNAVLFANSSKTPQLKDLRLN